jgi:hypothetical protein
VQEGTSERSDLCAHNAALCDAMVEGVRQIDGQPEIDHVEPQSCVYWRGGGGRVEGGGLKVGGGGWRMADGGFWAQGAGMKSAWCWG